MDGQRLASLRDTWLGETAKSLTSDPRVAGWGLVGSFGRGEADNWSDVDLLVIVHDRDFGTFVDPQQNRLWSSTHLVLDVRRNAPVGATSLADDLRGVRTADWCGLVPLSDIDGGMAPTATSSTAVAQRQ